MWIYHVVIWPRLNMDHCRKKDKITNICYSVLQVIISRGAMCVCVNDNVSVSVRVLVWMCMWGASMCAYMCRVHVCEWVHVWMSEWTCVCVCVCAHVSLYASIHGYVNMFVCVCTFFIKKASNDKNHCACPACKENTGVTWGDSMTQHSCTPSQKPLCTFACELSPYQRPPLSPDHRLRSLSSHFHMNLCPHFR